MGVVGLQLAAGASVRFARPDLGVGWFNAGRRLGEFLKRKTLPFNGYAEQVASLYAGMDLMKWF